MARVREIGREALEATDGVFWDHFLATYGPFENQLRVLANRPPVLRHITSLLLELRAEGVLPQRDLEIALVTVSLLNRCDYCVGHHAPKLVGLGLPRSTVEHLLDDEPAGLDARGLTVRDFARAVTEHPQRVPETMFRRLRQHFSEEQIVELTFRSALCGFFNRFNDALGIEPERQAVPAKGAA